MTTTVLQVIATGIAALAACLSYLAVRAVRGQTRASLVLSCLQAYIDVRRRRTEALSTGSAEGCKDYYRELFDLHWSEFQLYRGGHIPRSIMRAWLDARHRNYESDRLEFTDSSEATHALTYAEVWNNLVGSQYFAPGDRFVTFMNLVHDGKLEEALGLLE